MKLTPILVFVFLFLVLLCAGHAEAHALGMDSDLVLKNGTFLFHDTTFNIRGDLTIIDADVTFTGCTVNILLDRDQQHAVHISGRSHVVLDSSVLRAVDYQTDFSVRALHSESPTVTVRRHSQCLNHSGFDFFDHSTATVENSAINEVQAHDFAQISLRNAAAYPVLFFPKGAFTLDNLQPGVSVSRDITLPGLWKISIRNQDSVISGYQLDLFDSTTLTVRNSTSLVLSIHTPGNLPGKVSLTGLTPSPPQARTDSVLGLGPKFYYEQSEIVLFNLYLYGRDSVEVYGMSVNEAEAHDSAQLVLGRASTETNVFCNLLQSDGHGEVHLLNAKVRTDNESEPSALASGQSRMIFENTDLQALKIGGENFAKLYVSNCSQYNATLTHLFDSAKIFFSLPSSVVFHPLESQQIESYPNPADRIATMKFTLPMRDHVQVWVVSELGEIVRRVLDGIVEEGSRSLSIDAGGLPSGTYSVVVSAGAKQSVKRFVIVH